MLHLEVFLLPREAVLFFSPFIYFSFSLSLIEGLGDVMDRQEGAEINAGAQRA